MTRLATLQHAPIPILAAGYTMRYSIFATTLAILTSVLLTPISTRAQGPIKLNVNTALKHLTQAKSSVVSRKSALPPPTLTVQQICFGGMSTFVYSASGAAAFNDLSIVTVTTGVPAWSTPLKISSGRLTLAQRRQPGYDLASVTCAVDSIPLDITVNLDLSVIAAEIPETGSVICTFTNRGHIERTGHPKTRAGR
ncbi:MAG: prealbumin-like fold domain-containing protein [Hyphomicrobiaceae bacterium]